MGPSDSNWQIVQRYDKESWLSHAWKPENGSGFKMWQMYGMVWYGMVWYGMVMVVGSVWVRKQKRQGGEKRKYDVVYLFRLRSCSLPLAIVLNKEWQVSLALLGRNDGWQELVDWLTGFWRKWVEALWVTRACVNFSGLMPWKDSCRVRIRARLMSVCLVGE